MPEALHEGESGNAVPNDMMSGSSDWKKYPASIDGSHIDRWRSEIWTTKRK